MQITWAPGTRVIVTETTYATWDGCAGTVVAATAGIQAMQSFKDGLHAGTTWVLMDAQVADHRDTTLRGYNYHVPEPIGFDADELVAEPAALAPGGRLRP